MRVISQIILTIRKIMALNLDHLKPFRAVACNVTMTCVVVAQP